MTNEEIISLGWETRGRQKKKGLRTFVFKNPEYDYNIMSVTEMQDGFYQIHIKNVPKDTIHNEWENSECVFYGIVKDLKELKKIMMQVGVIEYKK